MSSSSTILAVGGVAVVGGLGFLWWRSRQQPVKAPTPCESFGAIVGDIAGTAAGPANASANTSARTAATLACNVVPVQRFGEAIKQIPSAIAAAPGMVARSPQSFYQTLKMLVTGGPSGCTGRHCCPPGTHSVEDHRASTLANASKAEQLAGVVKRCMPDAFPDGRPQPRRQGSGVVVVNNAYPSEPA